MIVGFGGLLFDWQADNTDFVRSFASDDTSSPVMTVRFAQSMSEGYGIQYIESPSSHILRLPDGELLCASDDWSEVTAYFSHGGEYGLALAAVCSRLAYFEGLLFHASCADINGEGVMFAGFSGVGKTTQAKLWNEHLGADVVNGDKILFRFEGGDAFAYGLPWKGSSEYCLNRKTKLKAIVIPSQSSDNKIRKLDAYGIIEHLMPHAFLPHWDKRCLELALSVLDRLQSEIPVWQLECRADEEAVKLTYNSVFDK